MKEINSRKTNTLHFQYCNITTAVIIVLHYRAACDSTCRTKLGKCLKAYADSGKRQARRMTIFVSTFPVKAFRMHFTQTVAPDVRFMSEYSVLKRFKRQPFDRQLHTDM